MIIYVALIVAFTYFYAFVQVNPEQMSENLNKQGGYVPGIRPGKNTEQYLTKILYRLTFVGSIFLAAIAILPVIFTKLGKSSSICTDWWNEYVNRCRRCFRNNEAARKPIGKTPLQRVYQAVSKVGKNCLPYMLMY